MDVSLGEFALSVRTVATGDMHSEESGLFVARDADQWVRLWQRMTASQYSPLPHVDWSTEMVVVVALGMRPSGGYSVEIEKVTASPDTLDVHAREDQPGPYCGVTDALTDPFHAVAMVAHDGQPRLIHRVTIVECE
jgi:hypothetical protein